MQLLRRPILTLIRTPLESYSEANIYFFITMMGTLFIFGYNGLSAVMRGLGDSRRPLAFVAIACSINVVLDLIFVGALRTGAAGAATATILSQGISMTLCIIYLKRNNFMFDFKLGSFIFVTKRLKMLLRIGIPMSIQNIIVGVSFMFLTAMVNTFGVTASAAVGAVAKLNGFAILPAVAMSSSVSAMTAQNIGAGNDKRAVRTMLVGMVIAFCVTASIFVVVTIFPRAFLLMFGNDEKMVENGVLYLRTFSFDYLFVPFIFCLNGFFIGGGHSLISLVNSIISSLLVRIPAAYIFGLVAGMGLPGVGIGAPIAPLAATVFGLIFFFSGKWKKRIIIESPAPEN
jgi:putative MATE family efflux protein